MPLTKIQSKQKLSAYTEVQRRFVCDIGSCTSVPRDVANKAPFDIIRDTEPNSSQSKNRSTTPFKSRTANTVICADFPLIHAVGGHVVVYYLTVGLLVLLDVVEIIPHIFITELKGCSII